MKVSEAYEALREETTILSGRDDVYIQKGIMDLRKDDWIPPPIVTAKPVNPEYRATPRQKRILFGCAALMWFCLFGYAIMSLLVNVERIKRGQRRNKRETAEGD